MLTATARPTWRPQLTQLEDRTTPFTVSGNTITLDVLNEVLSISTTTAGTYSLSSQINLVGGPPRQLATFTPAAGLVTVEDTATGTGVTFDDSTAEYANPFAVTLDNRPLSVRFSGPTAFGANDLTVTTTRNITVSPSPNELVSVTTTSGNITFSANMQATPTTGDFVGVSVVASSVTSVSGAVAVSGRGGDGPNPADTSRIGVYVIGGVTLGSTGSGNVTVTGIGGASTLNNNYGVQVVGDRGAVASITSGGGNVTVTGTGGGVQGTSTFAQSNTNRGVFVNLGGRITAGGTGAVSVTGTGGASGSSGNSGVYVTDSGSAITSSGGSVTVNGTGRDTGLIDANNNHGVIVAAGGRVTAGGSGVVSVTGATGGGISGPSENYGAFVTGAGSAVTSTTGAVDILGVTAVYVSVVVADGGTIASGANAPVTVTTDTLEVTGTGGISAGTGTVTIQPLNTAVYIGLGRYDHTHSYPSGPDRQIPRYLGLTDDELDRVTAGTLILGRSTTRTIEMYAPITRPTATAVRLVTAGDLLAVSDSPYFARFDTGGGPLTLSVGGRVNVGRLVTALTASTVTFSPDARLSLAPNNPETYPSFNRLDVTGALDLTGVSLVVSGNVVPAVGTVFTLATATNITGTFTGLPDGATVTLNGATLRVNYTATAVTATAVSGLLQPRVVTAVGDVVWVLNPTDRTRRSFVPFPGFTVSVASADLNGDFVPDVVVGAGPGGGPHVRAFDGVSGAELASFFAFDVAFRGGVSVAAGGGFVALGAGPGGGPHVKVISAGQLGVQRADGVIADSVAVANFFAFDVSFAGGVSVTLGDLTADGTPDLVVGAGAGGGPHVKVIDGTRWSQPRTGVVIDDSTTVANFFAFDPSFAGGVNVGATNGRFAVGAGAGGEPQLKLYRTQGGLMEERNDRAFDAAFRGGVRVGFADADADGDVDLLTAAGPGGGPHLKAFNLAPFALVRSEFVADPTDTRGVVV